MKIKYDSLAQAVYMGSKKKKISKTLCIDNELIVDIGTKGDIVGIEILNVKGKSLSSSINKIIKNNKKVIA
jgi:uncharacterized protein YuzE